MTLKEYREYLSDMVYRHKFVTKCEEKCAAYEDALRKFDETDYDKDDSKELKFYEDIL